MDKKRLKGIICFFGLLILTLVIIAFLLINKKPVICSDGTPSETCSQVMPYFCEDGKLIEKASICECPENSSQNLESCISSYQTNPKNISLEYTLNGKKKSIDFVLYQGANDYISKLSSSINQSENPSLLDFRLKNLNQQIQMQFLYPLLLEIEEITPNKEDQMRIAVSLVQNIPFESSNKTIQVGNEKIAYQRRAYEILYEQKGVCSEKSELLVFLLRELGYNSAFIYYPLENHEAVGIKCSKKYALNNTDYCFIETTGPAIITDAKTEYLGNARLSSTPEVINISEGLTLSNNLKEFRDAKTLIKIRETMKKEGQINFIQYFQFKKIKERYGLPDFTNYQF